MRTQYLTQPTNSPALIGTLRYARPRGASIDRMKATSDDRAFAEARMAQAKTRMVQASLALLNRDPRAPALARAAVAELEAARQTLRRFD